MKTTVQENECGENPSLQLLLNELMTEIPGLLSGNMIIVENEISAELRMNADRKTILPLISELLKSVVINARNTCISITAEKYQDVLTLHVKDWNNYNGYALSFSMLSVSRHARLLGGEVNIDGVQKREATISLSFPDTPGTKNRCMDAFA